MENNINNYSPLSTLEIEDESILYNDNESISLDDNKSIY
jgi:hypothetical protein